MFILLFHCFLWGMGGLDSHTRMSSIFVAFKRGERLLPLYFFLLKGGGLSFNLICQVIHCLLTKLKCKRKTKTPKTRDLFLPLLYSPRTVSYLSCGVKYLNFSL